MSDGMFVHV